METEPKDFSFIRRLKEVRPSTVFVGALLGEMTSAIILGPGGIIPGFLVGGLFGFALEWQNPTKTTT